jgi:hypothetical protein
LRLGFETNGTVNAERLLDFLMERVALEEGVVLLLLDALGHGLFIPLREITGGGLALFFGFGAF